MRPVRSFPSRAHTTNLSPVAAIAVVVAALLAAPARGQSSAGGLVGVDFFEKRVRPVLSEHCYKCHSKQAEKAKGGLFLDTREGMIKGGDDGPAIVPGHPEKSRLIAAVSSTDADKQMPPKERLPESAIADLTRWVAAGAPWPGGATTAAAASHTGNSASPHNYYGKDYDALRREHWAWQPVKAPAAPAVKNLAWPRNEVDRFVLAAMEKRDLRPVADADRATLLRRLSYDLIGLPPTPDEVEAFLADRAPDALEKVVDRLLASPRFGERWGRHWLDVARYAESTGSARNVPYTYAWRYRDYVIASLNADKPYDRFVREQVAGDLMPYDSPARHDEQLVATGFLAMGVKDLNERDSRKFHMDNVDEQLDVTTRAVMAVTFACARCHDHKFDPIPTTDYYSLAGIFSSTDILSGVTRRRKLPLGKDYSDASLLIKLDAVAAPKATALKLTAPPKGKSSSATASLQLAEAWENGGIEPPAATVLGPAGTIGADELAIGVRDSVSPSNVRVHVRGDVDNLGPDVPRGFGTLVRFSGQPAINPHRSGRLELAQWLTSPGNPLTARVAVNRIWQHLFGEGPVRTSDNFGTTGEAPANPELLDYLAGRFVREGWSVKRTIKLIVLSRAYGLSGTYNAQDAEIDPDDRCVWRMAPRRLEAEAMRDAILFAAGRLDLNAPVGSPVMKLPVAQLFGKKGGYNVERAVAGATYRSVYLPVLRELVPDVLDVFDFPEPSLLAAQREVTTVPTQALFLLNDRFVLDQAAAMAKRLQTHTDADDAHRVDLAYRLTLARPSTTAERDRAVAYVRDYAASNAIRAKDPGNAREQAWSSLCQALFTSAEFRYVR